MTDNVQHNSFVAALASVQSKLPRIEKKKTADIRPKGGGNYSYSFADLADIYAEVLPLTGAAGLAWTTCPTLNEKGRFVLIYKLEHETGGCAEGEYPLPSPDGRPQDIGSAITYARRYTFCAVLGIVPEDDDDGSAAERAYERKGSSPQAEPQVELIDLASYVVDVVPEESRSALRTAWKDKFDFATSAVPATRKPVALAIIDQFKAKTPVSPTEETVNLSKLMISELKVDIRSDFVSWLKNVHSCSISAVPKSKVPSIEEAISNAAAGGVIGGEPFV